MARSLGLAAYMTFARRLSPKLTNISVPRPDGELLWMHCTDPTRARGLAQLGLRLASLRGGVRLLLTTPADAAPPQTLPTGVIWQQCPSENLDDISLFLKHWRPSLMIWLGQLLRPALIVATRHSDIPSIMLEADIPVLEHRRWRWGPEPIRATLNQFSCIFSQSETATTRLRKMVSNATDIQTSGPLAEEPLALSCNEVDLENLRAKLTGRPVWLAAMLQPDELPIVLNAYRTVLRLSHRLLLVVIPDSPENAATILDHIAAQEWRLACWDDGTYPNENTQILFASTPEELGLWFRIAPVSFIGSSLDAGSAGRDPLEPAALGTAILHGPAVQNFASSYTRLANAGGARIVEDADSLAAELIHLSAPDQVAAMAHAGWQVVSDTAEVSDWIIEHSQQLLEAKGDTL